MVRKMASTGKKKNGSVTEPGKKISQGDFFLTGIGASAGGLEALKAFLIEYPSTLTNMAVVVAQHLSPTHKSMLVELLRKDTRLKVEEAKDDTLLCSNTVYITPPNRNILVRNGKLFLEALTIDKPGPRPSVDLLFSSMATEYGNKAIGIILSGTGTDGSRGIVEIKQAGGLVLVQEPATARFNGMPDAAIQTGMVDQVLPVAKMGKVIARYSRKGDSNTITGGKKEVTSNAWEELLSLLLQHKGTDFTQYKTATIRRGISRRYAQLKFSTVQEYLTYTRKHPEELDKLFSVLLINVTNFFRDRDSFEAAHKVLEKLIGEKNDGESLRIWIAACASGEEAYTIAILVTEIFQKQAKRLPVQLFATDIDTEALQTARRAVYPETEVKQMDPLLVDKYFIKTADGYEVVKEIRSMVLFSRHDITSNPPFLKLDFLSCRNLLIYFDKVLQQKVIPLFHYAIQPGGYLLLGKSESIAGFTDLFSVVEAKNKLFQRKTGTNRRQVGFSPTYAKDRKHTVLPVSLKEPGISVKEQVKETLFNTFENPCVVINEQGEIKEVFGDARLYLSFHDGIVSNNILKLANTELQLDLFTLINRCVKEHRLIKSVIRKFSVFGTQHYVRIAIRPVIGEAGGEQLYIVIFETIEKEDFIYEVNREDLNEQNAHLVAELEKELATTREQLQTYIEELETTNEELQSLNEELQSTNEQLQSTNEELETTNEELQSTNEEVQITYSELKAAYQELELKEEKIRLSEANLDALLNNTLQLFYLVDPGYQIVAFNKKAAETLRRVYNKELKAGDSVIDLIAPQNMDVFVRDFKKALGGEIVTGERSVMDINGNFSWYQYNYTPVITQDGEVTGVSMSMLDVTETKKIASELQTAGKLLASVFNATSVGIAVIDEEGLFVDVNHEFCHLYGYDRTELIGQPYTTVVAVSEREKAQQLHLDFINGRINESGTEMKAVRKDGTEFYSYASSELLVQDDGKRYKVKSVRDITIEKKANRLIEASQIKYRAIVDNSMHAFFLTKPDGTILEANNAACDLFGYTEEELKKIGRQGFIDHTDPSLKRFLQQREENGYVNGQVTAIKKNGERIICDFSSVVFKDINGEERTSTMMMDVTESKKLERLLDVTNQLAKVGGWELDLVNQKLYWTPITKQIHETAPDFEPDLETAINFYKEGESREKIKAAVERAIESGEPWQLDLQIITQKGNERWVRASGQPEFIGGKKVRLYGSFQDIHEQKLGELELERNRQEYESLYLHHPDGVFSLDLAGNFTDINNTALSIGEISLEEILGQSFLKFLPMEEVARVSGFFGLVKMGLPQHYETPITTHTGNTKIVSVTNIPVIVDKKVTGVYGIIRDISSLKKYEEDLKFQSHLLNTIQQAVIGTGLDGSIIYWNDFAESLYGWKKEEVLGKNIVDLTPTDLSMDEAMLIMEKLAAGESWAGEFLVRNKAGHSFKAQVHNSPVFDAAGKLNGIIGVSWDITRQQEAVDYIRFQANLLDSVEQAVIASDMEGTIYYWNRYAEKLYGWTREEAIGQNARMLRSGETYYEQLGEQLMKHFREGNSWSGEYLVKNKDGLIFPVFTVNSPIYDKEQQQTGIVAVSYDITERKNAEQQKEFERLDKEALINTTNDLIWSVNTDYTLIAANQAFLDTVKAYVMRDVKPGENLLETSVYPVEYLQFWKDQYDRGLSGQSLSFEIHVPPLRGVPERWSEVTINPIKNNQNIVGIACYGRDITERKQSEQTIRLSEERFRTMFTQAPMGIALIDSLNGSIIDVNEQFAEITGRTVEELKSIDWMSITHPDDVQEDLDNMKLLNEKKIPGFTMVKRYIKPDSSVVWIQMTIAPINTDDKTLPRHLCMIEDITARRLSEEAIRVSNERYNLVAKATNDAIWDWNIVTNEVERTGSGLEVLFGYDSALASKDNRFWIERIHPEDLPGVLQRREAIFKTKQSFWEEEYRFLKADGTYAYVNDKGYIIRNEEGQAIRMIGATQDISDRKKSELILKDLNAMLEKRAAELELSNAELERFAYVASHDLQEPLRMVSSFLQLLEKKYKGNLDETADKYIHFAVDGANRMKKLILDLLEYSRAGTNNDAAADTDMNEVVTEVMENLKLKIEELGAIIRYADLPVLPHTRRTQMVQLMQNLVSNSLKYHSDKKPEIIIESKEETDSWLFSVKDNGIGFDKKFAEKVFVIFQRLHNKSEYSGTGIGLSVCKKIVERYGGKIWVDSMPGEGSIFYFRIPK